jgi:hypothetical protein
LHFSSRIAIVTNLVGIIHQKSISTELGSQRSSQFVPFSTQLAKKLWENEEKDLLISWARVQFEK